jgi:hypothetical protein
MIKMAGNFREQEDAEQAGNGLGFEPPKRVAAPPGKGAGGGTAKKADGGAREIGKPPSLAFAPPRRGVALPAGGRKGATARASSSRVPEAKPRAPKQAEPARPDVEEDSAAEIARLREELKRERAEKAQALTEAQRRAQEAERRVKEVEARAAAEAEHWLEAFTEERTEWEVEARKRVAEAWRRARRGRSRAPR